MKFDMVLTTCPFCGTGCNFYLKVLEGEIADVLPCKTHPVSEGDLCILGRNAHRFVQKPDRLTKPLIRKGDEFIEVSWSEAYKRVADGLLGIKENYGPNALAVLSSAKCTNEENYLIMKFTRGVLGTNNIDHCARLCHAGSVAGLQLAIGSSAMSNSIAEMENLDVFIITGSNTAETHPVIANYLKRAVRENGAKLIAIDPRRVEMGDFSTLWLQQNPGTDVALFQAMAHVVVKEKLYDEAFIAERTEGFSAYMESLESFTPQWAEEICGVPAEMIVEAARLYANADRAAIYWGMGISQSTHGTDNTLSLTNLALMCGHMGKEGTGLNPLRGQNNVQGCSDSGGLPNVYTGYQSVGAPDVQEKFESLWGVKLNPEAGLTATEMIDSVLTGAVRGIFVVGENPMLSEPNQAHTRHALEQLEFLVCQDIFVNETGEMADVILPATSFAEKDGTFTNTDRRVQRCRKAVEPVGDSRPDWEIICDLGKRVEARLGVSLSAGFDYNHPADIWDEMRQATPEFWGIDYDRIEREGGVHWPCPDLRCTLPRVG